MALIARFSFDVPFGKKAAVFEAMDRWEATRKEVGFPDPEVLIGSIGTPESRVEVNYRFDALADIEAVWARLDPARMAGYRKDMAELVVPGSHRWEVFRVHGG